MNPQEVRLLTDGTIGVRTYEKDLGYDEATDTNITLAVKPEAKCSQVCVLYNGCGLRLHPVRLVRTKGYDSDKGDYVQDALSPPCATAPGYLKPDGYFNTDLAEDVITGTGTHRKGLGTTKKVIGETYLVYRINP